MPHPPKEWRVTPLCWDADRRRGYPFSTRNVTRSLGVTIDCIEQDPSAPEAESVALSILRELCTQPEFKAADTSTSDLPRLDIVQDDRWDFELLDVEGKRRHAAADFEQSRARFGLALGVQPRPDAHDTAGILAAHFALQHDLFVTTRPEVLGAGERIQACGANVCGPQEALKIAALLLRSRHRYVLRAGRRFVDSEDHLIFYNRLVWCHWPEVWPFSHACVFSKERTLTDLWSALLFRATRALLALDYIGTEFFQPQNNHTRDFTHYHLDYLFLLLVGILDAQARMTERVYSLGIAERSCSFSNPAYLQRLPPGPLRDLLRSARVTALLSIVKTLRNMIHGAQMLPIGVNGRGPERSVAQIPPETARRLPAWPSELGGDEAWGFSRDFIPSREFGIAVEPYQAALTGTREVLALVNEIARVTEIERIGGSRHASGPTGDDFAPWLMERTQLMGGL
jgi:hypothetical protein